MSEWIPKATRVIILIVFFLQQFSSAEALSRLSQNHRTLETTKISHLFLTMDFVECILEIYIYIYNGLMYRKLDDLYQFYVYCSFIKAHISWFFFNVHLYNILWRSFVLNLNLVRVAYLIQSISLFMFVQSSWTREQRWYLFYLRALI
jgi:hypothetical protein